MDFNMKPECSHFEYCYQSFDDYSLASKCGLQKALPYEE